MTRDAITRWTPGRKVELLNEFDRLSPDGQVALLAWHNLTLEEVETWRERFRAFGTPGLAQTRIQDLRP